MIDDIKDISRAEKEKAIARHKRARYFWQCIATAIVFAVAMTLFSLFMIGNFKAAFTVKNALATTGRMIIAVGMMIFSWRAYTGLRAQKAQAREIFT